MPVVQTQTLRKKYKEVEALKGVSLSVERGEVFGLLGQNGAGKTTLIKILLGITDASGGSAMMFEEPAGNVRHRTRVGYLPEDHRFPDYHTGQSLMDFYGQLLGLTRNERAKRIPALLEEVGLSKRKDTKIRTYSKGMKQRLGIAQALFHDPELIFLDEPTDGVDPVGRKEIREMIERRKQMGTTIFVNSHLLGEVEMMCDRVAILQRGDLLRLGTVAELTKQRGMWRIGITGVTFPIDDLAGKGFEVSPTSVEGQFEVALEDHQSIDTVLDLLHEKGAKLRHLVEVRQTLEDVFIKTVDPSEGTRKERKPRRLRSEEK